MKKAPNKVAEQPADDDLLPEYDFSGGERGKYAKRMAKGSNVVVLDPDVAALFSNSAAVNSALRVIAEVAARQKKANSA